MTNRRVHNRNKEYRCGLPPLLTTAHCALITAFVLLTFFPAVRPTPHKVGEPVMNNKALYWIALGVFALGLNSEYQQGNLSLIHRVADHTGAVICKIATRAKQTLAVARVLTGRQVGSADDQFIALQQAICRPRLGRASGGDGGAPWLFVKATWTALSEGWTGFIWSSIVRSFPKCGSSSGLASNSPMPPAASSCRPETGTRVMVDADPDIADLSIDVDNDQ